MKKYTLRRFVLFAISLFVNAFGIAFITKAMLGTSPITSVTYVLSMFTSWTIGEWTIALNLLFILLELPLMSMKDLKSDFRMFILQIPISMCFGTFIDISMNMLFWLNPAEYISKIVFLLIGCIILAIGIALEVKANAAMMAGEYLVRTISRHFNKEFGYVKLGLDITLLCTACVLSVCFMSGIYGVREGTVVAALAVGPIVHFISPYYSFLDSWIKDTSIIESIDKPKVQNKVITIAREYGSGGHLLGEMLSKELGLKVYNKEFIHMAAQKSSIDEDFITRNEQTIPSFWLKCIIGRDSGQTAEHILSKEDVLFIAESKIIQEVAEKEPCIIIGRCADFILKDNPKAIKVFCYSDPESAYERCTQSYGVPKDKAEAEIRRINRNRATHYEYYTGKKWKDPSHYDLMINTSHIDIEEACNLIKRIYEKM